MNDMNEQPKIEQVSEETTSGNRQAAITVDNTNLAVTGISNNENWIKVTGKNQKNTAAKTWRKRLTMLRGTAVSYTEGESLSANVHQVAHRLAKNVSRVQLL